jgi:hypothetical protein
LFSCVAKPPRATVYRDREWGSLTLREYWVRFVAVAAGEENKSVLPGEHGNVEPLSK